MSVARFIADQRTNYQVPHTLSCLLLGVSLAWFYKWLGRAGEPGPHTDTERRRSEVDVAVAKAFADARGLHGSPRLHLDLRESGWVVSSKTVADSMRRQGLVARRIKRRSGLTRQDKTAPKFPDLLRRDFTAAAPNTRWVGDMTEIPTAAGKLYLATVIDLYSRRLLGASTGLHPDADLAGQAIKMAVASRGGAEQIRYLHRERLHEALPPAQDQPVHGPGRLVLRQCRRRGVLLQPGMGGAVSTRVHQYRPSPGCGDGLVLRLLQPPAPPQRGRRAVPDQLRERCPHPRSGIRNPPRSRGNHIVRTRGRRLGRGKAGIVNPRGVLIGRVSQPSGIASDLRVPR